MCRSSRRSFHLKRHDGGTPAAPPGGDLEGTVDLTWDALRRGVQTYIAQQATSSSGPWTQCYVGKASRLNRHRPDQRHPILVPGQRHRRRRPQRLERPRHQTRDLSGACSKPCGPGFGWPGPSRRPANPTPSPFRQAVLDPPQRTIDSGQNDAYLYPVTTYNTSITRSNTCSASGV
jgi:hypothetical protein